MHTIFENTRSIIANALIIILKKKKTSKSLFMLDIFNCIQRNINFHKRKQSSSSFQLLHKHKKKRKRKKIESFSRYRCYPSFPLSLSTETSYIVLYHSGRGKKRVHFWKITSPRRTAACIIAGGRSTRKRDPPSEIAKTAGNSSESGEHQMHPVEYSYVRHRGALFMTRPSSTDHTALARIKSCSFDF